MNRDISLENTVHSIVGDRKVRPVETVRPWRPVSHIDARQWCLLNGQANINKLIPVKPTEIKPRQPWYKREPKPEWAWLIKPLQVIRRKWVDITLHIMVWGAVFTVSYAAVVMWLR